MKIPFNINISGKYIRLTAGIIFLILGAVFIVIPFIPLGYLFLIAGLFLLAYYIPSLNKILNKVRKKDKKGRVEKVEEKVNQGEKILNERISSETENKNNIK